MNQSITIEISVIIPCVNKIEHIDACLKSLYKQDNTIPSEIITIVRDNDNMCKYIENNFPNVIIIKATKNIPIPEMRYRGISKSKGTIIAITEDHCIVCKDWFNQILDALRSDYSVVGGAVENGSTNSYLDWATYFLEYSFAMPPIPFGATIGVTGNNTAYKKAALLRISPDFLKEKWEYFIHIELQKSGVKFFSQPKMLVHHKKDFHFLNFLSQRYHYSRSFSGMRIKNTHFLKRIIYASSTFILPSLVILRTTKNIFLKKRFINKFIISFPYLIIFSIVYAFGEFVGFIAGSGNSTKYVE